MKQQFETEIFTKTQFCKEDELKIHYYSTALELTDVSNALAQGKTCINFSVRVDSEKLGYNENSHSCTIANMVQSKFDFDHKRLFDYLLGLPWKSGKYGGFEAITEGEFIYYRGWDQGIRVFSPLHLDRLKPLKAMPKKWTVPLAVRAIVNKQTKDFVCNGVYSDDYAHDNACNYQQGDIADNIGFAKGIIEHPSGWRTWESDGKVRINCHSFDTNSFTPSI